MLAVDSPPAMCALIDTFEEAGVGRLMRDDFGERPALLGRKWSLRRVDHDANTGDGIRMVHSWAPASGRSTSGWDSRTAATPRPGIDVVGRRLDRIVETGTGAAVHFSWSVGNSVAEAVGLGLDRPPHLRRRRCDDLRPPLPPPHRRSTRA